MKNRKVYIIDYGNGNIGSLLNMFRHIGTDVHVASSPGKINGDCAIVLPGVGHFGVASQKLKESGFSGKIIDLVRQGVPLLGICVGMQLLFECSSEGDAAGLGLLNGQVRHFDRDRFATRLPVPNVGWRCSDPINNRGMKLLSNMPRPSRFYFVHSYHAMCADPEDATMESEYGYRFVCGVARGNVEGVQFHPEKSHLYGMTFLTNWLKHVNE